MFEWNELGSQGRPRDGPSDDHVPGSVGACRFPGCRRPARRHTRHGDPPKGGMPPLCRRHHWMVRYGGWRVVRQPDGSYTWVGPTGERYHGRSDGGD